jgi:hypothetical protein
MTDEVADFIAQLPDRWRHPVVLAFRQTLDAGIRYGYLTANPAKLRDQTRSQPAGNSHLHGRRAEADLRRARQARCGGPAIRLRYWPSAS